MQKLLVTISEAARMLDCDRSQIRYLINKGILETFTHVGQRRRKVKTESIYNYLKGES